MLLLLLLLLLTFIPDLLLQDNTIHTSLEQCTDGSSFPLEESQTVQCRGCWGAGEIGDFIRELVQDSSSQSRCTLV